MANPLSVLGDFLQGKQIHSRNLFEAAANDDAAAASALLSRGAKVSEVGPVRVFWVDMAGLLVQSIVRKLTITLHVLWCVH
jgi:hypothetical protein